MGERSRVHLPSLGALRPGEGPPTIEAARAALGGVATGARSGRFVELDRGRGRRATGLVVHETPSEADVWIGDGVFARVAAAACTPIAPVAALASVEADLARFAALAPGATVLVRRRGGEVRGVVRETCRYGALVEVDGKVLAVSFRLVAPA